MGHKIKGASRIPKIPMCLTGGAIRLGSRGIEETGSPGPPHPPTQPPTGPTYGSNAVKATSFGLRYNPPRSVRKFRKCRHGKWVLSFHYSKRAKRDSPLGPPFRFTVYRLTCPPFLSSFWHAECSYKRDTEITTSPDRRYFNAHSPIKAECCLSTIYRYKSLSTFSCAGSGFYSEVCGGGRHMISIMSILVIIQDDITSDGAHRT